MLKSKFNCTAEGGEKIFCSRQKSTTDKQISMSDIHKCLCLLADSKKGPNCLLSSFFHFERCSLEHARIFSTFELKKRRLARTRQADVHSTHRGERETLLNFVMRLSHRGKRCHWCLKDIGPEKICYCTLACNIPTNFFQSSSW